MARKTKVQGTPQPERTPQPDSVVKESRPAPLPNSPRQSAEAACRATMGHAATSQSNQFPRRSFLGNSAVASGVVVAGSAQGLIPGVPQLRAEETQVDSKLVQLDSGIEPLVQLIETTPRADIIEVIANKVRRGTTYQELLAALMLAGVRNVQPRPAVGFKFHSVLVVNSAHLAALASTDQDRWLPIFWALDYLKATQNEEERKTGWKMHPVDESRVPTATKARQAFIEAMERWDVEAADVAVAGLARTAGEHELFELFCKYGARDYRSIGHKAIFVANGFRTLQVIGWHHAEPVLRSLAYALLNHSGEDNPATSDLRPDRPYRQNQEVLAEIPEQWQAGKIDISATRDLFSVLKEASELETSKRTIELLRKGVAPQSLWDAVFLAGGQLLMEQPGIIGLHSLTTANALHYAYRTAADDQTRKLLLLQACSFLPMFRQSARGRGKLADRQLQQLVDDPPSVDASQQAVEQIFTDLSRDRYQAARTLYGYMRAGGSAEEVLHHARQLVYLKGRDAHDYKYSSAVLEDYYCVSPQLRNEFLALSLFNLQGAGARDSRLVERTRKAFA